MKRKLIAFALALAPLSFGFIYPATAAAPEAPVTYNFEGNLNRVEGVSGSILTLSPECGVNLDDPCNSSTSFGTTDGDGYWAWNTESENGGGFSLDTEDNLTGTYTIYLKFTFDDVDGYNGYNKIIDYLNRTSDTGFYMWENKIKFYDLGASTSEFTTGEPLTLMVTRSATTGNAGVFTVYSYNGSSFVKELEVNDEDGEAIPSDSTTLAGGTRLGFFYDDGNGEGTPSGKIWSLKIWPGQALNAADLEALATTPETEPTTPPTPEEETLADTGFDGGQAMLLSLLLLLSGAIFITASRLVKRN